MILISCTVTMDGHAHAREVGIWFVRMHKKRSIFGFEFIVPTFLAVK